jgi:glycosyltransferase involved in cell wall biosynthesis
VSSTPAIASQPECALIVPVYRNEQNIDALVARLHALNCAIPGGIEAVCVVDGSPDASYTRLTELLPGAAFRSRVLLLSRNFGSFAAIRAGFAAVDSLYYAVMAADLQEPAELVEGFFASLRGEPVDLVLGTRTTREDRFLDRLAAQAFWGVYRRFVQRELPRGGIDVFGCNRSFRDQLLKLAESNSSLVGQLIWLGFRRKLIPYRREPRAAGKSAWTFRRKLNYLMDSAFAFSDLPIRMFIFLGCLGLLTAIGFGLAVLIARLAGYFDVPGYAATVITILFFSGLNLFGLGIIGSYVWRAYENTKSRPLAVVMREERFRSELP